MGKNIPNDCLLVTFNVKSLYTNTANNEGIKAVREAYDNHPTKTVATRVTKKFLSLILTLNNFAFNSINYLQIKWDLHWVQSALQHTQIFSWYNLKNNIYPYIKNESILYLQYIDDIFMIWTGTKQELLAFLEN